MAYCDVSPSPLSLHHLLLSGRVLHEELGVGVLESDGAHSFVIPFVNYINDFLLLTAFLDLHRLGELYLVAHTSQLQLVVLPLQEVYRRGDLLGGLGDWVLLEHTVFIFVFVYSVYLVRIEMRLLGLPETFDLYLEGVTLGSALLAGSHS